MRHDARVLEKRTGGDVILGGMEDEFALVPSLLVVDQHEVVKLHGSRVDPLSPLVTVPRRQPPENGHLPQSLVQIVHESLASTSGITGESRLSSREGTSGVLSSQFACVHV